MTAPASASSSGEQPEAQQARIAEYNGICAYCHRGIRIGDVVRWQPGRAWRHDVCDRPRGQR